MKAMSSIMGDREAEGGASVLNPGEGVSLGLSAIADTSRSDMQRIYAAKFLQALSMGRATATLRITR